MRQRLQMAASVLLSAPTLESVILSSVLADMPRLCVRRDARLRSPCDPFDVALVRAAAAAEDLGAEPTIHLSHPIGQHLGRVCVHVTQALQLLGAFRGR